MVSDRRSPVARPLGRRLFLAGAACAVTLSGGRAARAHAVLEANEGGPPAPVAAAPSAPRRVHIVNAHTGDRFEGLFRDAVGPIKPALRELDKVLRDHREDVTIPIDPAVFDLLADVADGVTGGDDPLTYTVVSGYRTRRTNEMLSRFNDWVAEESLHIQGRAIDLFAEGVALSDLHAAALDVAVGGVGYYPDAGFIHLDVGPVRQWVRTGRGSGARLVAGLEVWPELAPVGPPISTGATDPSIGGQSLGSNPGQFGSSIGSLSTSGFGSAPRIGGQSLGAAPLW